MVKVSKFLGQGKVLWTSATWQSRIHGPPDCIQGNTGPGQAVGGDIGNDDSPLTGKKKAIQQLLPYLAHVLYITMETWTHLWFHCEYTLDMFL